MWLAIWKLLTWSCHTHNVRTICNVSDSSASIRWLFETAPRELRMAFLSLCLTSGMNEPSMQSIYFCLYIIQCGHMSPRKCCSHSLIAFGIWHCTEKNQVNDSRNDAGLVVSHPTCNRCVANENLAFYCSVLFWWKLKYPGEHEFWTIEACISNWVNLYYNMHYFHHFWNREELVREICIFSVKSSGIYNSLRRNSLQGWRLTWKTV